MCPAWSQIPYFNAPIFLENKTQIGKVEEILGPINNVVSTSLSPRGLSPLLRAQCRAEAHAVKTGQVNVLCMHSQTTGRYSIDPKKRSNVL